MHLTKDIQPLLDLWINAASVIEKVTKNLWPAAIIQHAKGFAILHDVIDYVGMVVTIELFNEATQARWDGDQGKVISCDEAMELVRERLN